MAVYTKLNKENIEEILTNYSIGQLKEFKGIEDGIENTNYFLLVDNKKYILTIYEKRVKEKDLPFFSDLMTGLNKENFKIRNLLGQEYKNFSISKNSNTSYQLNLENFSSGMYFITVSSDEKSTTKKLYIK